jgi:ATP/ADP translocase
VEGTERLRMAVAVLVVCVWGLSAVIGAITQNYTELGIITPVMMLVGAFLFGFKKEDTRIKEKHRNDLSDW